MSNDESTIRPVDIIEFISRYLTEVRGGGDTRGAYEAGLALVRTVRVHPSASYEALFYLGRSRAEAERSTYRPKSQDELDAEELEILARENPNLVGRTFHLT